MGKDKYQENFWSEHDEEKQRIIDVSILFQNKKQRDTFMKNHDIVFQFKSLDN